MIKTAIINVPRTEVVSIVCDKCGKEIIPDDAMEYQEIYHIRFTGGYSSVFGDESRVAADFCQQCLKEIIGSYCRVDGEDFL